MNHKLYRVLGDYIVLAPNKKAAVKLIQNLVGIEYSLSQVIELDMTTPRVVCETENESEKINNIITQYIDDNAATQPRYYEMDCRIISISDEIIAGEVQYCKEKLKEIAEEIIEGNQLFVTINEFKQFVDNY